MEKNNPLDFEEIVHQEAKKVFNLAYRLCGNQEEAKDISQETFVRAYEHFDRFQGSSRVFTYLYRITFNVWKNRLRHWSRHPAFSLHSNRPEEPDFDLADPKPAPAVTTAAGSEEKYYITQFEYFTGKNGVWSQKLANGKTYTFTETKRDDEYIYIHDKSRNISIALPKNGGPSYIKEPGMKSFQKWLSVRK